MNYFTLFELEQHYSVDTKFLEDKYLQMQLKYHPDKLNIQSSTDKDASLAKSAILNQAYKTLLDPLARAKYILSLNNIDLDSAMSTLPHAVLEEAFHDREILEDDSLSQTDLKNILAEANKLCQTYQHNLEDYFKNHNLQDALNYTIHLQYKTKFISEIEQKLRLTHQ